MLAGLPGTLAHASEDESPLSPLPWPAVCGRTFERASNLLKARLGGGVDRGSSAGYEEGQGRRAGGRQAKRLCPEIRCGGSHSPEPPTLTPERVSKIPSHRIGKVTLSHASLAAIFCL